MAFWLFLSSLQYTSCLIYRDKRSKVFGPVCCRNRWSVNRYGKFNLRRQNIPSSILVQPPWTWCWRGSEEGSGSSRTAPLRLRWSLPLLRCSSRPSDSRRSRSSCPTIHITHEQCCQLVNRLSRCSRVFCFSVFFWRFSVCSALMS